VEQLICRPLTLNASIEHWPLVTPFHITGHTFEVIDVLIVTLATGDQVGRGEAAGVYFLNDHVNAMFDQVQQLRPVIERGITRESLHRMLPAGGARNALDCALWDLQAKLVGRPAWELAELEAPRPLVTTFGCGADKPENMASAARGYTQARAIKLKLTGEPVDADRVRAVRDARPDVWLSVDANQGFTLPFLEQLMPVLVETRVSLIEQPLAVGKEALLEGFESAIPIAADESVRTAADIPALLGRFDAVNIKLDKCGGLTEALSMAREARKMGLDTMVGNMMGTSLAMAPAFLIGQLCSVVDLDGPLFLKDDRPITVSYTDGLLTCPETLWGNPQ
jgi:L-Ala-D/L-Glu epimerase